MSSKETKMIRGHLADSIAEKASLEIKNWNNGESLYEEEVEQFVKLFRVALLKLNGYE